MIIVRKYETNRDKTNVSLEDINEAFNFLDKKSSDVSVRIKWLNVEDIFFKKSKDYIRIVTKW